VKIAFLIMRSPEYRVYGPVIDAALARGWDVECWHDHGQLQTGLKGYQFPSLDAVPVFRNGRPVVRSFQGRPELRSWLAEMRADAVIAWEPAAAAVDLPLPVPRPFWVAQQYHLDSFVMYRPDQLLTCDLFAAYSRWWVDWAGTYYESEGTATDGDAFVRDLQGRTALVGLPELDAVRSIDPADVRRRWQIPADQPVVVLFVFPQGVGRDTFWPKQICAEPSRLKQLAGIARRGRFEYLPHVWHGWNDVNVVKALRRFCDRNGAYLLVKSRRKTPIPAYTEALADRCVYDESVYPATVLEALSVASLSAGYYTTSVFESVSQGVPHLCLTYTASDYNGADSNFFRRFYSPEEGSPFQFRGVTTAWSIPEALTRLPGATLSDFTMDRQARTGYIRKFLTHDAGDGGDRVIGAIADALARRARPA
jgi:hypothetical protein